VALDHRNGHPVQVCLTIVGVLEATYSTVNTKMTLFNAMETSQIATPLLEMDLQLEDTTLGKLIGLSIDSAYKWSYMTHYTVPHKVFTPIWRP
jgi:hypothetical protein